MRRPGHLLTCLFTHPSLCCAARATPQRTIRPAFDAPVGAADPCRRAAIRPATPADCRHAVVQIARPACSFGTDASTQRGNHLVSHAVFPAVALTPARHAVFPAVALTPARHAVFPAVALTLTRHAMVYSVALTPADHAMFPAVAPTPAGHATVQQTARSVHADGRLAPARTAHPAGRRTGLWGALFAFALTAPAAAGPLIDTATHIEAKLAANDTAGAIETARTLLTQVWDTAPSLSFTESTLVAQNATGYGVYNPRANNQFKMGEPILIYCEPVGFAYGTPGAGLYSVNFFVDLQVLDAMGNQLADAPAATEYNMTSRHQNKEVQANITYSLDGLQPGRYTLVTSLRDKNSDKSGSFQTTIEILP